MPLGPGKPDRKTREKIEAVDVRRVLCEHGAIGDEAIDACVAGIYLLHDELEASHKVSQNIPAPTGSFWHAIMHRREPDYANAKYWFQKVGDHPIFAPLQMEVDRIISELHGSSRAIFMRNIEDWDPCAFVDFVEAVAGKGDADEKLARAIQQCEWEMLFDFSFSTAMGAPRRYV
jgi:hypothetical protein